jgi:hypothetical protein
MSSAALLEDLHLAGEAEHDESVGVILLPGPPARAGDDLKELICRQRTTRRLSGISRHPADHMT